LFGPRSFYRGRDLCRGFRAVHPRVIWTALRSMYIAGLKLKQPTPRDRNGIQQTAQHPGLPFSYGFFRSRIGGAKLRKFSLFFFFSLSLSLSIIFCMIVASSSSSLCLPANLARGRLTRLIYVAQHFLQIIVNRPRIRAPDEGEVRVVDVKSVILPRSMAHEPHSLMMNDRCKCGTFQSVFFFHTAGRERSPKLPGGSLGTHRAFQSGSGSPEASFPVLQFPYSGLAAWGSAELQGVYEVRIHNACLHFCVRVSSAQISRMLNCG